jgi:hypothetical protein
MTFGMMFIWWSDEMEMVNEETMIIARVIVNRALNVTGLDHLKSY